MWFTKKDSPVTVTGWRRPKGDDITAKNMAGLLKSKDMAAFIEMVDRTKAKKHRMTLGKKLSCRKDKEAMEQAGELPVPQVFKNRLDIHEITK